MQVESHDRLDPLSREWDELADRVNASPWLRPGWIGAWERAFGRGSLEVLTLRRDGRLVGVLPLQLRFGALRSTSNVHTPAFSMLVEDQEAAQELARSLFARGGRQVTLAFHLADDPARVFSKAELLRAVWGYGSCGSTRTVDSHASRLRRKLDLDGGRRWVINVWGVGYRLL